jgi:hypothetical protein
MLSARIIGLLVLAALAVPAAAYANRLIARTAATRDDYSTQTASMLLPSGSRT